MIKEKNKHIIPNPDNLSLRKHFARLPKANRQQVIISAPKEELITEIARLCGKHKESVRRWMYGYSEPEPENKEIIARLLESTVEILFPFTPTEKSKKE